MKQGGVSGRLRYHVGIDRRCFGMYTVITTNHVYVHQTYEQAWDLVQTEDVLEIIYEDNV